jgi:hypothetical protein
MHVFTRIHIHACMHACIHTYIHTQAHKRRYAHTYRATVIISDIRQDRFRRLIFPKKLRKVNHRRQAQLIRARYTPVTLGDFRTRPERTKSACMYVCMCVCMYVCVCVCMWICTYAICMYVCMCICTYVYMHAPCPCMPHNEYIHTYILCVPFSLTHSLTQLYIYIYIYIYSYPSIQRAREVYIYIYTYIYIQAYNGHTEVAQKEDFWFSGAKERHLHIYIDFAHIYWLCIDYMYWLCTYILHIYILNIYIYIYIYIDFQVRRKDICTYE